MSISKQLLALAIGACLAAPASAQESLIDVYQRALDERPGHSRGRGHVSRDRGGQAAGAQPCYCRRSHSALARSHQFTRYARAARSIRSRATASARARSSRPDATGYSVSLTQSVFDWSNCKTLEQADKRVVRAETDFKQRSRISSCAWRPPTSTCLLPKTISRRPSRSETAFRGSSSNRNGASRSA